MADTAIKKDEDKKEYFDTEEELEEKIEKLALWVLSSEHFISFTGAGISTSCGIPDFRSGMNTVLPTGPGCWELAANKGKKALAAKKKAVKTSMISAYPSPTHMSFVAMLESGIMKYIVSQNIDGLHLRSGVPADKIAELHGNTNLEKCKECGRKFLRDFRVRNAQKVHSHKTGRFCDDLSWGGALEDSIINFGEGLPEEEINNAFNHAECADLCLSMGSSLRVTPAADVPLKVAENNGKLVIVNLQKTPLDPYAALKINAKCDDVMKRLMVKLEIEIPKWKIIRYCEVSKKENKLSISGKDEQDNQYSLFPKVEISINEEVKSRQSSTKEPHMFRVPEEDTGVLKVKLHFQKHYKEKPCSLELNLEEKQVQLFKLTFDPFTCKWESVEPLY